MNQRHLDKELKRISAQAKVLSEHLSTMAVSLKILTAKMHICADHLRKKVKKEE